MNETIKNILAGDREDYRQVVRDFSPSLRSYLSARLNNFHAIEDLSQEIFLAVYKSLPRFKPEADFRLWFFAIARNQLMYHLRQHYSKKNLQFAFESEIQSMLVENEAEHAAEHELLNEQVISKMKDCIAKLPTEARELIQARYFISETVTSLAERLQSSENAISSKLFRLRSKLKQCIDSGGNNL